MSKTYSQGNILIHVGPSFPISDFASDDFDDKYAGGAAGGINIGFQYLYPLKESGFSLFGGIDFNYNGLKKDVRNEMKRAYKSLGLNNSDIKFSKYINIPITAGLNYAFVADDEIGVFANVGLALNFLKITDMESKAYGQTVTNEMDLASRFGLKVGGGILIKQKFSISVDYMGLGKYDIDGEVKGSGASDDIEGKIRANLLALTLGYQF